MKISGFTFVRNAVKLDYPIVESIKSILPICDEYIVLVGNSEDDTRKKIEEINSPKLKIFDSIWDDSLRIGGVVLANETDKAKQYVSKDSDWLFYLQADEVVHEKYHELILESAENHLNDSMVEALLFKYRHFYGSYKYFGDSRKWYRREIRIIRNNPEIKAYRDAQGFRLNGRKLNCVLIDAEIFHYGWVKSPIHQKLKEKSFQKLWHDDNWMQNNVKDVPEFDYSGIDSLKIFQDTHPSVMKDRIENSDWNFEYNIKKKKMTFTYKLLYYFEKLTGLRPFEYRNYKLIKK